MQSLHNRIKQIFGTFGNVKAIRSSNFPVIESKKRCDILEDCYANPPRFRLDEPSGNIKYVSIQSQLFTSSDLKNLCQEVLKISSFN